MTSPLSQSAPASPPCFATWLWLWCVVLLLSSCAAIASPFFPALALIVCLLCAGFDAATARIPNQITYTAILLGLTLNGILPLFPRISLGAVGPLQSLAGFAVCAGIGLVCLFSAGMGGGDMKLLAALGAILGFSAVGFVLLCALAVAVLYALINLAIVGRLNAVFRSAATWFLHFLYLRRIVPVAVTSKSTIPLAVPLFLGLVASRLPLTARLWQCIGGT